MADIREYVVHKAEEGTLHISEDVLASVAALAAADVEGVGRLVTHDKPGRPARSKSVKARAEGGKVAIDVWMQIAYGHSIPAVAKKVQAAVTEAVDAMTGLRVSTVRLHVTGVEFPGGR
jgi:uncharacterized alkaline shock family protein YloU